MSSGDGIEVGNWTGPSTGNVWPASYPGVIPVIATKKSVGTTTPLRLRRADSNFRAGVAIFAPGQDIRTYNNNNNATYYKHKTSLAAAVVSGIAALAWSYDRKVNGGFNLMANSGSTPNLRGILTTVNGSGGALGALRTDGLTTSATPSTSPDDSKGIGRIDARYALDAVPGAPAPSWPSLS